MIESKNILDIIRASQMIYVMELKKYSTIVIERRLLQNVYLETYLMNIIY
jgi:hypothetical protein